MTVGMREVIDKQKELEKEPNRQGRAPRIPCRKHPIPLVLGPGGKAYLVDRPSPSCTHLLWDDELRTRLDRDHRRSFQARRRRVLGRKWTSASGFIHTMTPWQDPSLLGSAITCIKTGRRPLSQPRRLRTQCRCARQSTTPIHRIRLGQFLPHTRRDCRYRCGF